MPVRSNRGRAAVYRRVWGWPMRSRGHLTVAAVAAAVAVILLGLSISFLKPTSDNAPNPSVAQAEGQGPSRTYDMPSRSYTTSSVSPPPTSTTTPASEAPKAALDTARQYALRWTVHPDGVTPEQFLAGLRPWSMPELLITLEDIDPSRIVENRLTGPVRPLSSREGIVEAAVPTDVGELRLTLVRRDGWKVDSMTSLPGGS